MATKASGRGKGPEWLPDHLRKEAKALRKIPARERVEQVTDLVIRAGQEGCVGAEAVLLQVAGLKPKEYYRADIDRAHQRRPRISHTKGSGVDDRWPWLLDRRYARFLGPGGILAGFERRNDHLVQVGEMVRYVSLPPLLLDEAILLEHLREAVLHEESGFERHGPRGKIAQLIKLDDFDRAPVAGYSLRLTHLEFEVYDRKLQLWLPRSVWAQFLKARSLPLPAWLARSVLIEGKATSATVRQAALPAPIEIASPYGGAAGTDTSSKGVSKFDTDAAYVEHRDAFQEEHGRFANREEDYEWARGLGLSPVRERVAQLRRGHLPDEVYNGGRGKNRSRKPVQK